MNLSKSILIIGKVWPEPNSSAAGLRMMQLIEYFNKRDFDIVFASTANQSDFQEDISLKGVRCETIELNNDSFDNFIIELQPQIVLFDRFMVEEQFGWRVTQSVPDAIKILNTEDLHFLRDARKQGVKNSIPINDRMIRSEMAMRELVAIQKCDLSLFVSEYEVELLKDHYSVPSEKLAYLPLYTEKNNSTPSFEERSDFMFIGNFYHDPNWDAVQVLKKEVWPIIRKALPKARLLVYGAYTGQKVLDLNKESEGFIVKARADDADAVTKMARVSLSPLRFGAGIKGKLLEAMKNGTPSVTTSIGAESMTDDGIWNGAVEDNFSMFSEKAIELYQSFEKWEEAQKVGFEILEKKYKKTDFEKNLNSRLFNLEKDYKKNRENDLMYNLFNHHSVKSSMYLSRWIDLKNKTTLK